MKTPWLLALILAVTAPALAGEDAPVAAPAEATPAAAAPIAAAPVAARGRRRRKQDFWGSLAWDRRKGSTATDRLP